MRLKYVKTLGRASFISIIFPGVIPGPSLKRGGTPGKRRKREGREGQGTEAEGKGGEGGT
jgi:hypothetical protein